MLIKEYEDAQQNILYQDGKYHVSHNMFLDLSDMWLGCVTCNTGNQTTKGCIILKEPCKSVKKR